MPMRTGQRVQPCLVDEEAVAAIDWLAEMHPNLTEVMSDLGRRILGLTDVCLREQIGEEARTYDIAFVRPPTPRIPRSRRKAFATFITPGHPGRWTPAWQDGMRVGVKFNPGARIQDPHDLLQPRSFGRQGGGGWHDVLLNEDGSNSQVAFDLLQQAYHSFD